MVRQTLNNPDRTIDQVSDRRDQQEFEVPGCPRVLFFQTSVIVMIFCRGQIQLGATKRAPVRPVTVDQHRFWVDEALT